MKRMIGSLLLLFLTATSSFRINPKIYGECDADLATIRSKKVCIIGFGSQGRAHALNLRDSGVKNLRIALPEKSLSRNMAGKDHFSVVSVPEGVQQSDVIMLLAPDPLHKSIFEQSIKDHLQPGAVLLFAHGFNIHYEFLRPPLHCNIGLVAPKGPGHLVRSEFKKGFGVPVLVATGHGSGDHCLPTVLSYAKALGGLRAGGIHTTFSEETETDLFGEQAILCGGVTKLIEYGFETLVESGYSPEIAYFECLHELKLITDLIYEGGFETMRKSISDTAEFGDYYSGRRVITPQVKKNMRSVLRDIQNGSFAKEYMQDFYGGSPSLTMMRDHAKSHLIEQVGWKLRQHMLKK